MVVATSYNRETQLLQETKRILQVVVVAVVVVVVVADLFGTSYSYKTSGSH